MLEIFVTGFLKWKKIPVVGGRLKGERLALWGLAVSAIGELDVSPVPTLAGDDLGHLRSSMR